MVDRTTSDRFRRLSETELPAANSENRESHAAQDDGVLVSPVPANAPELPMVHHEHALRPRVGPIATPRVEFSAGCSGLIRLECGSSSRR
jgi:hypothetical protein